MTISIRQIFTALTGMILSATSSAQKHIPTDWSVTAAIPTAPGQQQQPGLAGGICGVSGNVLIIAGGSNFPDSLPWQGGKKKYHNDIFILSLHENGPFSWLNNITDTLPLPVAYSACVSAPEGVFSVGGENEKGLLRSAMLIRWDAAGKKLRIDTLPDFPFPVTNAAAAYSGGVVYVAGGETASGVTDAFYALKMDALKHGWQKMPGLPAATSHTLLIAQRANRHTQLYLTGGRRKDRSGISKLYDQVYAFDIQEGHWHQKKSLPYPLSAGTGAADGNDAILVFGGDKGETFHQVETLLAAIAVETDALKKQELISRKNQLQINHPGFSRELLVYDTRTGKWHQAGMLPFTIPVTTTACTWGHTILIAGGEIRAGVRTKEVITGKLH